MLPVCDVCDSSRLPVLWQEAWSSGNFALLGWCWSLVVVRVGPLSKLFFKFFSKLFF